MVIPISMLAWFSAAFVSTKDTVLVCLNQMLFYAVCLSYHSNTEAVLFACLSSGWTTITGRLLGLKAKNNIKCLFQGHSDALPH